jgi:membrane protease YdiL (CAAX protease family)
LVVGWMVLGRAFRLDANAYLLLGIALTILFQLSVARRPLVALWVRDARRFRMDGAGLVLAGVLMIVPARFFVRQAGADHVTAAVWGVACLGGALCAAFALRQGGASILRPLLGCLATAGALGIAFFVAAFRFGHGAGPNFSLSSHALPQLALVGSRFLLFFPACFAVEEVTFRGAIDAHVHHPREGRGLGTALLVGALWGLWHLPISSSPAPWPAKVVLLTLIHATIGVPLSLFWRRSGNLVVPAASHALIDAVRDALALAAG